MLNATVYHTCSMLSGKGLDMSFGGSFGFSWLGICLLFFIFAFGRRWVFEELLQMAFNLWIGFGTAALVYFFTIQFMCSPRFAIVFGLIAGLIGGWFGGTLFEGGSS